MCAVFRALDSEPAELADYLNALDNPFGPEMLIEVDGKPFGWQVGDTNYYTLAPPALWTIAALAAAVGRPDLVRDHRHHILTELNQAEEAADVYQPMKDGGWNVFPRQTRPEQHATYTTVLAFLALLELNHSGLPWHDHTEEVDAMLGNAARWLAGRFDGQAALPGWRVHLNDGGSEDRGAVSDGLTLQIYSEFLRAEEEANIAIPSVILESIPNYLKLLLKYPSDYPDSNGVIPLSFTNLKEEFDVQWQTENYFWYPWAIGCVARWLRRLERAGGAPEAQVQARRILGYLLIDLGTRNLAAEQINNIPVFNAAEILYALATVISQLKSAKS